MAWQNFMRAAQGYWRAATLPARPADSDDYWYQGLNASTAGQNVTAGAALGIAGVYAAVRLISETLAYLPLPIYERSLNTPGDKRRAQDHPLWDIWNMAPNSMQTAFEFKEMMQGHLLLRGNAYAEILPGPRGAVDQLWPLHPDLMRVDVRPNRDLLYRYQAPDGGERIYTQDEIFHLRGLSSNGVVGLSPIALHRETFGGIMAAQDYGNKIFRNDAAPGGVLTHPGTMGDEPRRAFEGEWNRKYGSGGTDFGKTAVLEEGMTWARVGMTNEDAQYLETKQFSLSEIARIFRVPPHMIGDLTKSSFSNIEQQSLEFIQYSMMPWFTRWEQAISKDLILNPVQFFPQFLVQNLLRGDVKTRQGMYVAGRQWGWFSANDIRRMENLNSIGSQGDTYLVPLNMHPADEQLAPISSAERQRQALDSTPPTRELLEHLGILRTNGNGNGNGANYEDTTNADAIETGEPNTELGE